MSRPKASVIIPTLNAGPAFEETLRAVFSQKTPFDFEVLVLDSGSSDGTVGLAERLGASVHHTSSADFDHGAARDLGVSLSKGSYVALLVQDAVPLDDRWLASMVEVMEADPSVAGVYGRQVPRPDSGPLARVLVENAPTSSHERRVQSAEGPRPYESLPPGEQRDLALFDNVSSCLRRSVWLEIPFGRAGFGEDLRWGKRTVEAGHKLVYEPRSAVVHSHERAPVYNLRRGYAEGRLFLDLFDLAPVPNFLLLLANTLLATAHLLRRLLLDKGAGWRAVPLAVGYAVPSQLGLYLATKRDRLPARLDRFLRKGV